jgi:hypothetical protein
MDDALLRTSPSNLCGNKPGPVEQHPTSELVSQLPTAEVALVDAVPRAVIQDPLLPPFGFDARAQRRFNHKQLPCHPASLDQKCLTFVGGKMSVEAPRQDSVEGVVSEG